MSSGRGRRRTAAIDQRTFGPHHPGRRGDRCVRSKPDGPRSTSGGRGPRAPPRSRLRRRRSTPPGVELRRSKRSFIGRSMPGGLPGSERHALMPWPRRFVLRRRAGSPTTVLRPSHPDPEPPVPGGVGDARGGGLAARRWWGRSHARAAALSHEWPPQHDSHHSPIFACAASPAPSRDTPPRRGLVEDGSQLARIVRSGGFW